MARHIRQADAAAKATDNGAADTAVPAGAKPARAPAGSAQLSDEPKPARAPTGSNPSGAASEIGTLAAQAQAGSVSVCAVWQAVIEATRPRMPRHKGKVERGVDYVQDNALKGRTFASLEEENRFLCDWERSVANTRVHGTTRQQVSKLFAEGERPALQALPAERFPFFHEGERSVHRDGHVEVDKAYYSVPPEYVTRKVP